MKRFTSGPAIVFLIAAAKLIFHLATANRYGIFCDELYYIACSRHLDWGYVDQPPLIALITWIAMHVFGTSLLALRLLPAIAGAALVWLTGKLAREMGGGRFAQVLAALAVACVPIYMTLHHWMTMNAFEPLIWLGCAWCVVRAINTSDAHYWLGFGMLTGLGMENKYSAAFFVIGVAVGLIATRERKWLASRWIWIGAAAAIGIFLPNLIWLARHDFPFLELMRNVRASGRDVVRAPVAFIADQALIMNPVLFPIWVGGVVWLFASRYRVLGWTFAVVILVLMVLGGTDYYVAPLYPMAFAGGAIAFESITRKRARWTRAAFVALLVLATAALAPMTAPILPVESFARYQKLIGLEAPQIEHHEMGPLPQWFADEFGWEDMAREVARVYNSLPVEDRARTAIFCNQYSEAAALDFYGPKYGLPPAISNHQNYWYWGPRNYDGSIVIVTGSDGTGDREHFRTVEIAGRVGHIYARGDRHFPVLVCRGLIEDLRTFWPKTKNWG
jgi:4-amino-4-deoxy-L-arabinose transferase-like glycosyltransferase